MSLDGASSPTAEVKRRRGGAGRVRARTAVWLAWSVSALAILAGVLFLVLLALNSRDPDVATYEYWGAHAVTAIVFPAVGAFIVSRYPRNALGWLFCLIGLSSGLAGFALVYATYALVVASNTLTGATMAAWLSAWVGTPGFVSFVLIPLLFPDGPPSRRWQPLVWIALVAISAATVSFALMPAPLEGYPSVDNPFGIEGARGAFELLLSVAAPVLGLVLVAGIVSLILRYRRARGAERQQLKWFTYAAVLTPFGLVGNTLFPELAWLIGGVSVSLVPLAIGIAILRYRLYDIDFVINRTLVYATLTACVVGIYVLIVGYLGALFQTDGNLAISLIATGVEAVLFAPLRDRLQRGVNRLLYGERDEPYTVISRLGERLRATDAPEAVLPAIVETVAEALKLPHAAITLKRDDGGFETAASFGSPLGKPLILPLSYGTETIGRLTLSPRSPGEPFSPADTRLFDDLARHAEAAADALLAGLKAQTQEAISDIRRLVYDLRPPALDELGLIPAIHEQATSYTQNGLNVSVEAPEELPPLPAAVEVATYRIVQEALTNVAHHARARACRVRLSLGDELELEITDDGIGLSEDRRPGVGLSSMRERAAELGGVCTVEPAGPTGGTRVLARLPLPASGKKP